MGKQTQSRQDSEWVYGIHAVTSVLRTESAQVLELLLDERRRDGRLQQLIERAQQQGVALQRVSKDQLHKHVPADARHQGVVAKVKFAELAGESALQELLPTLNSPLLLVLDGVEDPHNLGACIRSAAAAGVDAIVIPKDKAVGLTSTARNAAAGTAEQMALFQVTNLARTLKMLKDSGIWLVGLAGDAEVGLYQQDFTGPLAVVMGAEGAGMRRLTREHCDYLVNIPMAAGVESLNVSVATGVTLFEAVRQRG